MYGVVDAQTIRCHGNVIAVHLPCRSYSQGREGGRDGEREGKEAAKNRGAGVD